MVNSQTNKPLKEVGYIEKGMILIDKNGKRGTITKIGRLDCGTVIFHLDDNPNFIIMDWERLRNDLYVEGE